VPDAENGGSLATQILLQRLVAKSDLGLMHCSGISEGAILLCMCKEPSPVRRVVSVAGASLSVIRAILPLAYLLTPYGTPQATVCTRSAH
jgi:hypothetical protein